MKKMLFVLLILFAGSSAAYSQYTLNLYLKDNRDGHALTGATARVQGSSQAAAADASGFLSLKNLPQGTSLVSFRLIGYNDRTDTFNFPATARDTLTIYLQAHDEDLDEVVISSTRSSRTIQNIPTRVELIAAEELDEKMNMKPSDIRMVLYESTGIQVQQTSATTANASIRTQGLDGRYTQILKDGFPLYAGFAGGLGLLQIPPLDLKQVEIIKGSSSTLYGGGAIAGLVNLISKTPSREKELTMHLNGTTAGGLDLNTFYSKRFGKTGLTLFASRNSNAPYDPAHIDLTAIPKFERYTVNPKLFFYFSEKTRMTVGLNAGIEDRIGGDIHYIRNEGDSTHSYFERNKSKRISTQSTFEHEFGACSHIIIKNSLSYFDRALATPGYEFRGKQYASFTEATYANHGDKIEWVAGLNLWTDRFSEEPDTSLARDYTNTTFGAFVQNTWKATEWLSVETGLRGDQTIDYGFSFLPRLSTLFRISQKLSSRIGGGMGYKVPTVFTEESERLQFRNILPVDRNFNKLEKSYGGNADLNYRTAIAGLSVSVNQLFFYTRIDNPLLLAARPDGYYRFVNIDGHTESRGSETNIKLGYGDLKLFVGYTYTDTRVYNNTIRSVQPLTPKHKINSVLMYELEEKWKLGLEGYYFGTQQLSDGSTGRDYWVCGFMAERLWKSFSVYINFENFLDIRQTKFGSIYTGSFTNPIFNDIYAPLDGFVVNGGLKLKL